MSDRAHDDRPESNRRRLLQAGAAAAALGALPCTGIPNAAAQAPFDWKRFKGEKIEVFHVKSPRGDLLTKYHKEFEDLTGITIGSESIPEQQQRQKAVIEFNSGNTTFDVIEFAYHVQKRLFGKSNWLVDVRPLVADKSLLDPAFGFANFSSGGMNWATQPDGRIGNQRQGLKVSGRAACGHEVRASVCAVGAEAGETEARCYIRRAVEDCLQTEIAVEQAVQLDAPEIAAEREALAAEVVDERVGVLKSVVDARLREIEDVDADGAEAGNEQLAERADYVFDRERGDAQVAGAGRQNVP